MINEILLLITLLSFLILGAGIIYIIKLKRFEDDRIINSINILVFGLFFLLLYVGINFLNYLDKSFHEILIKISINIPVYIQILNQISNTAFIPLFVVCLLAAMISLKEI